MLVKKTVVTNVIHRTFCDHAPIPNILIFGFEGTIGDTRKLHESSLTALFVPLGQSPVPKICAKDLIGESISRRTQMLKVVTKAKDCFILDEDIFYKESETVTLYPDVIETLNILTDSDNKMAICSNMSQHILDKLMVQFSLKKYFSVIVGGNTLPVHKPDAGHLLYTVELVKDKYNLPNEASVIMIGDSTNDIKAAKSAGIPCIGVTYGYSSISMDSLRPDIMIDKFSDIPDAIVTLKDKSTY